MGINKRIAAVLLLLALALTLSPAAWCADIQENEGASALSDEAPTETQESAESSDETEVDEELSHMVNTEELDTMISAFIQEHGINEANFELAFCYTGTGETYYRNADYYMNGASLYKLSLNMGLARKVSSGELSQTDEVVGMDISYIENRSLVYSDNAVSEALIGYFAPFRSYRLMQAEIAGIPEEELPEEYFSSNTFSARFMLGVLQELWNNQERYPNILDCMLIANPYEYFRRSLEGVYDVAQKYGGGDGYLHTAGIIFTPTPIMLVVMTYHVTNAEAVIAELAQMMADYSNTLDGRRDAILFERAEAVRLAEEEEARLRAEEEARIRAQEEARLAEEEAARLAAEQAERERLLAEEEARQAQAHTAAGTASAANNANGGSGNGARGAVLIVLLLLLLLLAALYVLLKLRVPLPSAVQKAVDEVFGEKTAKH